MAVLKSTTDEVDSDHDPGGCSADTNKEHKATGTIGDNENLALNHDTARGSNVQATPKSTTVKTSVCQKLKRFFSLTKEGATPMKWNVLFLVVAGLFGSCYSITFLFPFLPDMILYFGYKEEEKGYFVGLVASSMFAGRIFGSYFWGWLSDVKGRRPVLLICLSFIMVTNLMFGFSINIYLAMACRFLNGLCNGVVGTSKTVLYEISDNTNQALGMSSVALAWGSGIILGPLISGYLAEPATKYPTVFTENGIFGKFPYLLASLVATFMCLFPLILLAVFLPETLNTRNRKILKDIKVDADNPKREESSSLLDRGVSQSASQLQHPTKPVVNRQLSRVKATNPQASGPSTNSVTAAPAVVSPQKPKPNQSATPALSVTSLDYADSGRAGKHDVGVGVYGYGCIVTSQGDLLLPDVYSSRSSYNPRTFGRQFSNKSDSGVTHGSRKNVQKPNQLGMSALASSHSDVQSIPLQESLPSADDKQQMQFKSLPDVAYKPKGDKINLSPPPEDDESLQEVRSNVCCRCLRFIMNSKVIQLMKIPNIRNTVLIYTIMSFGVIGFDDVFTVWASTDAMYSGLSFSSEKIGAAIGLSSAPLVLIQVFLFPKLEAKFGAKNVFMVFCLILIANAVAIPSLRILRDQTVAFWTLLLILMGFNKIAQTTCFSANGLHINNSVPANFAGSVNGLAMTYTAIGRTIAPTLGGSIFAWSIVHGTKIGFPLDVNLVFILFSFTYLVANIMCARLPDSLNKQSIKDQAKLEEHTEQEG